MYWISLCIENDNAFALNKYEHMKLSYKVITLTMHITYFYSCSIFAGYNCLMSKWKRNVLPFLSTTKHFRH